MVSGQSSVGISSARISCCPSDCYSLAWLNIIAGENQKTSGVGITEILQAHYKTYGRNFFSRFAVLTNYSYII